MFDYYDADRDGMLNKPEIKAMLTELYAHGKNRKHHEVTNEEVRDFIDYVHRQSGNQVTKEDFYRFYKEAWK